MTDNRTTELQSLSKLKTAGKLRYWRGTIEIPESELHAICDEIQAEHDQAIAATLGGGALTADDVLNAVYKHGARWQAIADELNSRVKPPCDGGYCPLCGAIERTCHKVIPDEMEGYVFCSECGAEIGEYGYPNYCQNCGCKVIGG